MNPFLFIFLLVLAPALSSEKNDLEIKNLKIFLGEVKRPLSSESMKVIEKGEIITKSEVLDFEDKKYQSLNFFIIGIHPSPCEQSLKKLSHYENYKNLVDFIKVSTYDENEKKVFFTLDSKLLPVAMNLSFKIPRIEKPGNYPFTFDHGFFSGLTGNIHAYHYQNKKKCLLYTEAYWKGTHTKFPNFMVEMFSETLSQICMEKMIRVTKF